MLSKQRKHLLIHKQGYHTVLISKICPYFEGGCLRKLHFTCL